MSKLFSIALSLIILIQSLGLGACDIVKVDEFIAHAQFHNKTYGDSVFVFIAKHYGNQKVEHEKEHQEEKQDHEQLPFQHQSHISTIIAIVLNTDASELKTVEFSELRKHKFYYQAPSSSLHSEGLFQPPRQS